jgi:hypothetical protein
MKDERVAVYIELYLPLATIVERTRTAVVTAIRKLGTFLWKNLLIATQANLQSRKNHF